MGEPEKKTGRKSNLPPGPGPGRPKGVPNKSTQTLKDAILLAAATVGLKRKPDAPDGLTGYLISVAESGDSAMCQLLAKVLPMTIQGGDGTKDGEPIVIHLHAGPRDKA